MKIRLLFLILVSLVAGAVKAQTYTTTFLLKNTKFTIECNTSAKTATIVDYQFEVDDREYPLKKGERKVSGYSGSYNVLTVPETVEVRNETYTITGIGRAAFAGFRNIETVNLPNTITEIGDYAFFRSSINRISIPSSVTSLGVRVFARCDKLKNIKLPEGLYLEHAQYIESKKCVVNTYKPDDSLPSVASAPARTENPKARTRVPSDVDQNIPHVSAVNENMFAIIIANENYQTEAEVKYALNDGRVFNDYCRNVLGIPEENIRYRENATLNNMIADLDWAGKVAQAFDGSSRFIVYYAGHGIPDETTGTSYLLPVDGTGTNVKTGMSLTSLYKQLGDLPVENVTVFMDACFSGSLRGDGMLASARGVAFKSKQEAPKGKMIVFSAAQGDETAYPYEEQGHGLFTYYLLKKLKETEGKVSLADLGNYVVLQVKRKSIVANGKLQTPSVSASANLANAWRSLKLR